MPIFNNKLTNLKKRTTINAKKKVKIIKNSKEQIILELKNTQFKI